MTNSQRTANKRPKRRQVVTQADKDQKAATRYAKYAGFFPTENGWSYTYAAYLTGLRAGRRKRV